MSIFTRETTTIATTSTQQTSAGKSSETEKQILTDNTAATNFEVSRRQVTIDKTSVERENWYRFCGV